MLSRLRSIHEGSLQWLARHTEISEEERRAIHRANTHHDALAVLEIEQRASLTTDYLKAADRVTAELQRARRSLADILHERKETTPDIPGDDFTDWHLLARVYQGLGQYDQADQAYKAALLTSRALSPKNLLRIRIVSDFAHFLAENGRNLGHAEDLCHRLLETVTEDDIPQEGSRGLQPKDYVPTILETLSLILNNSGRFEAASAILSTLDRRYWASLPHILTANVVLNQARASAGLHKLEGSNHEFCHAMVLSAITLGNWHYTTLRIFYAYGLALLSWGRDKAASVLLLEAYLGRCYRLGRDHPQSVESYEALRQCSLSQPQRDAVNRFRHCLTYSTLQTIAYEHMELWTIADFLSWAETDIFAVAENIIASLLMDPRLHRARDMIVEYQAKRTLRLERAIAACEARLGRSEQAALRMERMVQEILNMNKTMMLQCDMDLAIYLAQIEGNELRAQEFSQHVFFGAETLVQAHREGRVAVTGAFQRRLAQHGLTHFEFGCLPGTQIMKPAPFARIDRIGRGAFAEVESVELYGNFYARKSMFLRRSNERQLREIIENEISVIKSLRHPHIVSIYCTYQEKQQFAIVLEPLASADLETFLDQLEPSITESQLSPLIETWLLCLTTTLAFMHGHGVRHKDIKTKNILVKGKQIIYSDFGSSRAFLEENAASTEGPAYGHTRMYSAPEVIAWERRNTSADVFSLGCVLTEMVNVLCQRSLKDYHDFRYRMDEETGRESHAYHTTLDLVDAWFSRDGNHLPAWGCELYQTFIKPMLQYDSRFRPSAMKTSNTMKSFFESRDLASKTFCSVCYQYPVAGLTPSPGIDDSISLNRTDTGAHASSKSLSSSISVLDSSIISSATTSDSSTTSSLTTVSSFGTSSATEDPTLIPSKPTAGDSGATEDGLSTMVPIQITSILPEFNSVPP